MSISSNNHQSENFTFNISSENSYHFLEDKIDQYITRSSLIISTKSSLTNPFKTKTFLEFLFEDSEILSYHQKLI